MKINLQLENGNDFLEAEADVLKIRPKQFLFYIRAFAGMKQSVILD